MEELSVRPARYFARCSGSKRVRGHVEYMIEIENAVQLDGGLWTGGELVARCSRRFSAFQQLHKMLNAKMTLPAFDLPRRVIQSPWVVREREVLLQNFLNMVLRSLERTGGLIPTALASFLALPGSQELPEIDGDVDEDASISVSHVAKEPTPTEAVREGGEPKSEASVSGSAKNLFESSLAESTSSINLNGSEETLSYGCHYPMYTMDVGTLLALEVMQPHEEMLERCAVHKWDESLGPCLFLSHRQRRGARPPGTNKQ